MPEETLRELLFGFAIQMGRPDLAPLAQILQVPEENKGDKKPDTIPSSN